VVFGIPEGRSRIGLVLKRTYTFQDGGGSDAAGEDQQEPVTNRELPYGETAPPRVSPIRLDNDLFAFRMKTDLVVQGNAYTYFSGVNKTHVTVRVGSFERTIRVYGDRQLVRGLDGKPRFTEPEPFDTMPVRYDRAFGGVDVIALSRNPAPKMLQELAESVPGLPIDTDTPFHYARNPCGRGFLIHDDDESLAAAQAPNLEFPFDWISPDRMVVGSIHGWVSAPLPACMDWQSAGWFPRIAYLGAALFPPDYAGPVRETELGWAAPDLVTIPPATMAIDELPRFEFTQGASAGMSLESIAPGQLVELRNLHPVYPHCTFRLPEEVPHARLALRDGQWTELEPHLNAVVIRPETDEVVMTWCASAPIEATCYVADPDELRREVWWQADGGLR